MKILMISGDNGIMDETSEAHERMRSYAAVCDELHIVVLTGYADMPHAYGNLFIHPATGNKVTARINAYRAARSIAARYSIDVVTAQSPDELGLIAYMIARSIHARLQLQVHTDIMSQWYRRAGIGARIKYIFARLLLPRADCIRVVSRRIASSLMRELSIAESKITVVPIFTDREKFMHHGLRIVKDARTRHSPCPMIAVGRFVDKEKNFSMLIRAMTEVVKAYPPAILIIVGDGPDKAYYQSLITVFNLSRNVFLEPWRKDMHAFYRSFDLLVLPSYIEGWGRAVIEAMASGLPVLMTDVGVAQEVVHDGINGRIIPVADQSALVSAIIDFYAHPEMKTQFARAAQETVLNLSPRTKEEYYIEWKKSFDCCIQ